MAADEPLERGLGKEEARKQARDLHERYGHISYNTLRTLPEFPKEMRKEKEKIRC